MSDERAFDVEEFAEGVKRVIVASFPPGGIVRGCSCCCTQWVPIGGGLGGEIAELPQDQE